MAIQDAVPEYKDHKSQVSPTKKKYDKAEVGTSRKTKLTTIKENYGAISKLQQRLEQRFSPWGVVVVLTGFAK